MITQYQISTYLTNELPALNQKVYPATIWANPYSSMNYFSSYTKRAVEQKDFNLAKKCFALAEQLYRAGDKQVRSLVENIFVFGFSNLLPDNKFERVMIRSMIPRSLYALYIAQVTQPGC